MVFKIAVAAATGTPTPGPIAEEEEYYSSWSLFLVCLLLILSLLTSYYLQIKRIRAIHETLVSIFAGMFVGLVVRLAPGTMIREMLTFRHTLFFNLLLPPIILNSGYELKQENFFRNFGSILIFAFFGTFISAVGVGVLVFIYSYLGIDTDSLPLIECLIFGSTLSATDPVTILAIFNQYKVDPKLYTVIFGESLLNDAVSIVMYETLSHFRGSEIYLQSIFHGIGIFLVSFSVSMALGVIFGLATSLMLKHSYLHMYPSLESCLVALSAYTCYFFSNGMSMSGIVSLLFCGITLKHYAYHTMSRRTQRTTKYIFSTLAQLSENFIFIYLGLSLFTSAPADMPVFSYVKPVFILITLTAVVFTRYAAVFPLSSFINLFLRHVRGQRTEELPHSYQMMLFWAGLRGAVGVALAAGFKGPHAQMMRTTVLIVVVGTVVIFGGTTARMLEVMGIRTGVQDEDGASSDEEEPYGMNVPRNAWSASGTQGRRWGRYSSEEEAGLYGVSGRGRIGSHYANQRNYYNHQFQNQNAAGANDAVPPSPGGNRVFSSASSDSYDYDSDAGEVLPLAPAVGRATNADSSVVGQNQLNAANKPVESAEEGKWFQALDERYLLPIFSNATASRTFHARRSARRSNTHNQSQGGHRSAGGSGMGTPVESEDELDLSTSGQAGTRAKSGSSRSSRRSSKERDSSCGRERTSTGGGTPTPANANRFPPAAVRTMSLEDSRTERGLASPVLRSNAGGSSSFFPER